MNKYQIKEVDYLERLDRDDYENSGVRGFYVMRYGMNIGFLMRDERAMRTRGIEYIAVPPREMVPFRPADGDWRAQELEGEDFYAFSTELEACDYLNDCYQTFLDLTAS